MNFFSQGNEQIKNDVQDLLGKHFPEAVRVNFGVAYSQNRKLSVVVIEMAPCSIVHSLIFFYTRGLVLYDAWYYRGMTFHRLGRGGDPFNRLDRLNKFILGKIPKYSPLAPREIKESSLDSSSDKRKDEEIQRLKDRLRIQQDSNRSLRNQLKTSREREKRALDKGRGQ